MKEKRRIGIYSKFEENMNVVSHAIGLFLSIVAFVLLLQRALEYGGGLLIASFSVYGLSLILLYSASTFYHHAKDMTKRAKLQVFDHTSIYVLIAGTYTPFMLIALNNTFGWILFSIIWTFALVGVILKLFFTGRFDLVLTIMYIVMGWIIVIAIKPLLQSVALEGVILLFAGGISYTLGAVIYRLKKIPLNHAIFHICVLIGSLCHFISVYFYVV
jgi:hemolysin III